MENGRYKSETDAEFLFLNIEPLLSSKSDYETTVPTTDEEHIHRSLIRTIPSLPRQQLNFEMSSVLWNLLIKWKPWTTHQQMSGQALSAGLLLSIRWREQVKTLNICAFKNPKIATMRWRWRSRGGSNTSDFNPRDLICVWGQTDCSSWSKTQPSRHYVGLVH